MPIWAAATDVAARIAYGTISTTSNPTTAQVEGFLDEAEAQVRQVLRVLGLEPTLASSSDELLVAKAAVVDYAVAEVLASWGVQRPELLPEAAARRDRWDRYLEALRQRPTGLGGELTADGAPPESAARFRAYFADENGEDVAQRVLMSREYD